MWGTRQPSHDDGGYECGMKGHWARDWSNRRRNPPQRGGAVGQYQRLTDCVGRTAELLRWRKRRPLHCQVLHTPHHLREHNTLVFGFLHQPAVSSDTSTHAHTLLTEEATAAIHALKEAPEALWTKHKFDVGLIRNCDPATVTPKSSYRPCQQQHLLKQEAFEGMRPLFRSLLETGATLLPACVKATVKVLPFATVTSSRVWTRWS